MKNKTKTIIEVILSCCALVAIVGIFFLAYEFGYHAYANEPYGKNPEKKMELVIHSGESLMNVAEKLEDKEMISSKEIFWFRSKFSEYDGLMKAGTYEINETMGIDDILEVITQSDMKES